MKKQLLILTIYFLTTIGLYAQTSNDQKNTSISSFIGSEREGAISFVIDNVLFVGLGKNADQVFNDFYKYNSATDKWTQIASFSGESRTEAEAFVLNGKAYVGLGKGNDRSTLYKDFYEFDPATETWKQVADFGGTARYSAVNFVIDNIAYVGTGRDADGDQKDFWKYDATTNQWSQIAPLDADKRFMAFAFSVSGKGYVGGGYTIDPFAMQLSGIRQYDPTTNSWKEMIYADGINLSFNDATAFVANGKAYIAYGNKESVTEYDPQTNKVKDLGDVLGQGTKRNNAISFILNKEAYIGLGKSGSVFTPVYNKDILSTGIKINESPVIADQAFSIEENSAKETIIGTLVATDPESEPLSFEIVSGNEKGVFSLDATTGKISVANDKGLDYESEKEHAFIVSVSDGTIANSATVTITVNDVNEAPEFVTQELSVDENSEKETLIGTIVAKDPESDKLNYRIASGNKHNAFTLDLATGELSVNDPAFFDYETGNKFTLTISTSDGVNTISARIDINIEDVNEAPEFADQEFSIDENLTNGTTVGMLQAKDPEFDALDFTIESGNTNDAFLIESGELKVNNEAAIDYETTPKFELAVNISDGVNSGSAKITVNLKDLTEITSMKELAAQGIRLYPTPADSWINIELEGTQLPFDQYTIVDFGGKKIKSGAIIKSRTQIDVSDMNNGLYFIQLKNNRRTETIKFSIK